MDESNHNLLGDLIWSMTQGFLEERQVCDVIQDAIDIENELITHVRCVRADDYLEVSFCLKCEDSYMLSRINDLHAACSASDWAEGRAVRFLIYKLSQELDNGRNQQTTTPDSQ